MNYMIFSYVKSHEVENGLFIYNEENGTCYGIEGIGGVIWKGIINEDSLQVIIGNIRQGYHPGITLEQDVKEFIDQLLLNSLIKLR
ncbi:PqqD family protein [Hazenella sp. IB182353]|nr:PqqD family protein [Polycladospora coralii]